MTIEKSARTCLAPRGSACGSQEALANASCEPAAASTDSFLTSGDVTDAASESRPRPSRFSPRPNPPCDSRHSDPEATKACPCRRPALKPGSARGELLLSRLDRVGSDQPGQASGRGRDEDRRIDRVGAQRVRERQELFLVSAGSVLRAKSDSPWCQRTCVTR